MTKAKTPSVDELSDMAIDAAKPHIAELTDQELQVLRAKEVEKGDDKARTTFLSLIDGELAKRADDDDAQGEDENAPDPQAVPTPASLTAETATAPVPSADQLTLGGQDAAPIADDANVDWKGIATSLMAVCDEIGAGIGGEVFDRSSGLRGDAVIYDRLPALVAARLEEGRRSADDLRAATARIVDFEQTKALGVPPEGVANTDFTHVAVTAAPSELSLAFKDGNSFVEGLSDIPVDALHFHQRSGDTVIYDRQLDFTPSTPAFTLSAVALLRQDGAIIDTCSIIPPMAVGGGRSVALPAGTLMFRQPAVSAARAA